MNNLIQPKEISVTDIDGESHEFVISKVPATVGREIVATYPVSMAPKIGDYQVNEAIMLKMMAYVGRITRSPDGDLGEPILLKTRALIDNHCADWQVLAKLEMQMLEYNTSFFGSGKVSKLLDGFAQKVPQLITKILMDFSEQLSERENKQQPSKSSEPSTA